MKKMYIKTIFNFLAHGALSILRPLFRLCSHELSSLLSFQILNKFLDFWIFYPVTWTRIFIQYKKMHVAVKIIFNLTLKAMFHRFLPEFGVTDHLFLLSRRVFSGKKLLSRSRVFE